MPSKRDSTVAADERVSSPKKLRAVAPAPSPPVTVYMPGILKVGAGVSLSLPEILVQIGARRPLIVTDRYIADSSGLLPPILAALTKAGCPYSIFKDCVPDPTTDSVAAGLAVWSADAEGARCDCAVGIGGGSSIDTAKAVALLAVVGGKMADFKAPNVAPAGLPIVAIPTTAGTGSEATRFTIITDTETQEKMLCVGHGLMPRAALVDYTLTRSMPFRLAADSGLDALCHAMEAYVSRKANPFSDLHALAAMRAIPPSLRAVCSDASDDLAREGLMAAAMHAGIAFSNASVTLIHGMSRPIGAAFHVPHGLSNAMLLPTVTDFSLRGAPARYADCSRAMGFASACDGCDEAGAKLCAGLRQLCVELRVPSPAEHGIPRDVYFGLLDTMASQALASGSPANNPVVPSAEDIKELYRQAFDGAGLGCLKST